jgi:polyribonucleotide nucleotidyltransferase
MPKWPESDLDLFTSATTKDIVMYEGAAKEITEADFNAALKFAQEAASR